MKVSAGWKSGLKLGICGAVFATSAFAESFDIPSGDLSIALESYIQQTGVSLIISTDAVKGAHTRGIKGEFSADAALSRILTGTGFDVRRRPSGTLMIVPSGPRASLEEMQSPINIAQASVPARAAVETVTVTSSKLGGGDVQSIPIAITAMSQEQLTATQTAGGPDLVKQVPNLTFSKTNFTGYNIQIRGIGTQAISVTTDPAVAVAFNDIPFIRNHFFEQEFYDVGQVEVLRGPQGTLYGRNATAGVVNLTSARPTDQFEAMASADFGNYNNRRFEGMLNLPIVDDRFDIRLAGEWTKRKGYAFNETTGNSIDGRDLWSTRLSISFQPTETIHTDLIWEHFSEDDDRARSTKQLCEKDVGPASVDGVATELGSQAVFSQGCLPVSLYSPNAFQTPNGTANPIVAFAALSSLVNRVDPYASLTQSRDLRTVESVLDPRYRADNDVVEWNTDVHVTPSLSVTSQSGFGRDLLYSTEDFNRFAATPNFFSVFGSLGNQPDPAVGGVYCDPQLGCTDKFAGEDLSQEHAWQFSQEFRMASAFSGPLNFSLGINYLHYETVEDYFVFQNLITLMEQVGNGSGPGDYTHCYPFNGPYARGGVHPGYPEAPIPYLTNPSNGGGVIGGYPSNYRCSFNLSIPGTYIDPNPLTNLDGNGHNYFRSENPYLLNSYAGFGEVYYQVASDLKLTGGLRWTEDNKHFLNIPSWVFEQGGGYPVTSVVDQQWNEVTGRFVANWTPKLDFTDQTLVYASYSRGYKGGGANPPPPISSAFGSGSFVTHPPTFAPEFVNAFELGSKNSLGDNTLTLNGDVFYYDYKGYQISQIVDRTSVNLNFDATVKGAELESTWEPIPGLRFNFAGGWEVGLVNKNQPAIDLMDRTAGHSDWMIVRPSIADTSNCILPVSVVKQILAGYFAQINDGYNLFFPGLFNPCDLAYFNQNNPAFAGLTLQNIYGVTGFDPSTAPNSGEGFTKDLGGNDLPNTPHFTLSFGSQYTMPVSSDWAATLRGDFYWQADSWARIFNDNPYDRLRGYTNLNLSLILTSQGGWQAVGYVKNVFNTTAITGAFLNSDDTALTTNIFVTDPRLFGVRLTKNW